MLRTGCRMKTAVLKYLSFGIFILCSCQHQQPPEEKVIVAAREDMDITVSKSLKSVLSFAENNSGKLDDSTTLKYVSLVSDYYNENNFKGVWSHDTQREPLADSLLRFIANAKYYGLYPSDYHLQRLTRLQNMVQQDTAARMDAMVWTRLDLLSTDAFFHILRDLNEGRLIPDSLSIAGKENYKDSFFVHNLKLATTQKLLTPVFDAVEPTFFKYRELKELIPQFVDSMDLTNYPQIIYPYTDSLAFVSEVYARIANKDTMDTGELLPDAATFEKAVKIFQKRKKLTVDGKPGPATIRELNNSDVQKFRFLAVSLDRYKMLPPIPPTFVWVNIPSYHLQVFLNDSLALTSKTIVGKAATPTPELTSSISNMVVYPNWTIPASIIRKEILPALKKDPDYLSKKGYNLFDAKGEIINPYGVNWARYSTGIPWKVVQGSGDDNALGVFKFNFNNPYAVYLHDTNQRYLFANNDRAISHGCVRVQKWQQLADIITSRDSTLAEPARLSYSEDSIKSWVANGVRKTIYVRNRFPLFIVYFTCEAVDGEIRFYPDIYNEDAKLYETYFTQSGD